MLSALLFFILYNYIGLIQYDRLIFRNQCFHNNPTDQVSHCAYTEDYKVTGRFSFESHECHGWVYELCSLFE